MDAKDSNACICACARACASTYCGACRYIRNHSKSVLERAIRNDTHFLSELGVMDYSLLVGFDEAQNVGCWAKALNGACG